MKIIINKCFGGFRLSDKAHDWLINNKDWKISKYLSDGKTLKDKSAKLVETDKPEIYGKYWDILDRDELRINKDVIDCIETIGEDVASNRLSELKIVEIPDDVDWEIDEYDGVESIHEKHRIWN